MPNLVKIGQIILEIMCFFDYFKIVTVLHHPGFRKSGNFNGQSGSAVSAASPYQILSKSVKRFRRYSDFFDFSSWRLSAILDL